MLSPLPNPSLSPLLSPSLSVSRRTRSTPFTSRVEAGGVKAYTVYNHMLLPTVFRSLAEDYWHLCQHVQVWDVSAERQVQLKGPDAARLVQLMTPRDISAAKDDQCFYLPLCDENGSLVNDPIGIKVADDTWWLSIADSDVKLWARGLATGMNLDVEVTEPDVWPVAIQGPKAETLMLRVFGNVVRDIRFFRYKRLTFMGHEMLVARSGWSKQGGFEIYVNDAALGQALWDELFTQGADLNVGHGCPNGIERIEAGLMSFGSDMDDSITPLQCGLDKYCHLDHGLESLSVAALARQKAAGILSRLMGIVVPEMAIAPQSAHVLVNGLLAGEVTSHCLSARYDGWLAFAIMDSCAIAEADGKVSVHTDQGDFNGLCVELPFDFAAIGGSLRERQPA